MRRNFTRNLFVAILLFAATQASAQYVVNTDADSGPGSLRQAILDANAAPGAASITFSASFFITLQSTLTITDDLTITATPGEVALLGSTNFDGLTIQSDNVNISGLTVYGFSAGIFITGVDGTGNTFSNNLITGNNRGFEIENSSNNIIGPGNIIGNSAEEGIEIHGDGGTANGNWVYGNTIESNGGWGVFIHTSQNNRSEANNNIIGSDGIGDSPTSTVEGNIIMGNGKDGVGLEDLVNGAGNCRFNRISRNRFGDNVGPASDDEGAGMAINLLIDSREDAVTLTTNGNNGPNNTYRSPYGLFFGLDPDNNTVKFTGQVPSGATVEFYLTSGEGAVGNTIPNYQEGTTFLISLTDDGPWDYNKNPGRVNFIIAQNNLAVQIPFSTTDLLVNGGEPTPEVSINAIALSAASGPANTSEFSVSMAAALPVKFESFDATLQGDKVLVAWVTAQEQNASHFDVQRSTDGVNFTTIGTVQAKGNSSSRTSYSFTDNDVPNGVSYYRLIQMDLDNKGLYTKAIPIRNESRSKAFSVWPNPVADKLNITLTQSQPEKLQVRVLDMNGRTMQQTAFNTVRGVNQLSINLGGLPRGVYNVYVTGGETSLSQRIIKN